MTLPYVASLNVGRVAPIVTALGTVSTGFFKRPTDQSMCVGRDGFVDDEQADLVSHGGPLKAVYAYGSADLAWWSQELSRDICAGLFGENLTVANLDLNAAHVGDRWLIGTAELMITQPRVPCYKFATRMDDPAFPRRFAKALRTGLYLAVTKQGHIRSGDRITVSPASGTPSILETAREVFNMG